MVFSSLIFLYAFFPLSLAAYFLCTTKRAQNLVLLVFSLIFYAWGEPKYVLLLVFMSLVSWYCARNIEDSRHPAVRRVWLILAAVVDIGLILWFKYSGMLVGIFMPVPDYIRNIALPIGISFYTFQLLTYVVDVYREEARAQDSFLNVLLYAALFHQCVAGPIVRYSTVERELFSHHRRRPDITGGLSRFCVGLSKKVLLANPCGAVADALILSASAAADPSLLAENLSYFQNLSVLGAWVGVGAYTLHIYLDFSAYSDMAIGMGLMLGLHYPENFNYPYIARTVTGFWRRWHISLSTFFRDYVYIPLGGNRGSWLEVTRNTLIVWLLTGLWHGASWNFVLWGLWYFVFLILERLFLKKPLERIPAVGHLYVLVVVSLGWVLFRFTDLRLVGTLMKTLFGLNGNPLSGFSDEIRLQSNSVLLIAAVTASTPLARKLRERIETRLESTAARNVWNVVFYGILPAVLLLLSTANLVGDSYNPFLYFQF